MITYDQDDFEDGLEEGFAESYYDGDDSGKVEDGNEGNEDSYQSEDSQDEENQDDKKDCDWEPLTPVLNLEKRMPSPRKSLPPNRFGWD